MGGGASSATRGIFGSGGYGLTVMDFITFASAGNATDFADMQSTNQNTACSSETMGLMIGGNSATNVIQFIIIATKANALDFGDLTSTSRYPSANSNGHGGLA